MQNLPAGQFKYSGSSAWAPIRLSVDTAIQFAKPEFQLRYVAPSTAPANSETGIEMLLDGTLTFAQSSQPLRKEDYERALQKGIQLKQIAVAVDNLAIAVHPSLNIPGLTLDQLKLIYSGRITNWREVEGPDLQITRYRNLDTSDDLFAEALLQGETGAIAEVIPTTTEALRAVAKDPGGIYYASAPLIVPQCIIKPLPIGRTAEQIVPPYQEPLAPPALCSSQRNRVNTAAFQSGEYPLARSLFVIIKEDGGIAQQAGETYANLLLTDQGQDLLAKAGFVRVR